jgi:hypothetical protein
VIAADDPERVALLCQDSIEGQELGLFLCPRAKAHAKVAHLDELLLCDPVDAQLAGEGIPLSVHIADHNHGASCGAHLPAKGGQCILIHDPENRVVGCGPLVVHDGRRGAKANVWPTVRCETEAVAGSM